MTDITIPQRAPRTAKPRPAEYHDPLHATRDSVTRHVRRYREAIRLLRAEYLPNGAILDCACGTGYGTAMLARAFPNRRVVGVDRSPGALAIARKRHREENVGYREADITRADVWLRGVPPAWEVNVGYEPYAAIVCIETIEHLEAEQQATWIKQAHAALGAGGLLVVTCPVRESGKPVNPWHLHEPTLGELMDLMGGTGAAVTTVYAPERYISTAGEEAWQATAMLRRIP